VTRVYTAFVGCKVSQADADGLGAALERGGHVRAGAADADVAVVVTCCVTAEAERKSRQLVNRLAAGGRPVVVTGCAAAYRPQQFSAPGVAVAARSDVGAAVREFGDAVGSAPPTGVADGSRLTEDATTIGVRPLANAAVTDVRRSASAAQPAVASAKRPRTRTRFTLKAQDGCSCACAYCAVRLARGPLWSQPLAQAVTAARVGLAAGRGEIVLSGINLGLYRDPDGADLAALVGALVELPGLLRLRLSSLEPAHLQQRLLRSLAHPKVARHLHVPLQSADDGVLTAMNRPYDFAGYRERLAAAREVLGDVMISTDVIVGFPTETEEAFARTLAAIEPASGLFGRVHVFPYSRRPGTAAADLPAVPVAEVRGRRAAALEAAAAVRRAAAASEVGTEVEVLVEDGVGGLLRGYTSKYTRCYLDGDARPGILARVAVQEIFEDGVRGVVA
jgi:threonylcarbamoyladenosine tRNA methylthiotransferase MtaB